MHILHEVLPKQNAIKQMEIKDNCNVVDTELPIKVLTQFPLSDSLKLHLIRTFITVSVGLDSI